jgi:hypothetical protein
VRSRDGHLSRACPCPTPAVRELLSTACQPRSHQTLSPTIFSLGDRSPGSRMIAAGGRPLRSGPMSLLEHDAITEQGPRSGKISATPCSASHHHIREPEAAQDSGAGATACETIRWDGHPMARRCNGLPESSSGERTMPLDPDATERYYGRCHIASGARPAGSSPCSSLPPAPGRRSCSLTESVLPAGRGSRPSGDSVRLRLLTRCYSLAGAR